MKQQNKSGEMNFDFKIFPEIKTERLVLKKPDLNNHNDVTAVFKLRSSEEINKFIVTKRVETLAEAKTFIMNFDQLYKNKSRVFWLIKFEKQTIGSIVLHQISTADQYAEIGYKLKPKYQNKGIMSEALKAVLQFGFSKLKLKTIEAFTHKNNLASIALLEKHHFKYQPERRDLGIPDNRIWKLKKL
ncbi:GNAT family N-acetyltransferase [uncultured Polaribacter sp.]|uniref:GNAT family N-acetyltransferase n=1 Tax=uncultured Polaribacter sp. TaxID=174711 RepID=UPI00262231B8|nr:GNAT family N-acetyltransferase [uncultured Polaribacter sp.]